MKIRYLLAMVPLLAPVIAGAQVGVSVSIGDPGFYGRIDIGDYPQPRLIYAEPIVIERVRVSSSPLYLRVPPGHAKNWSKHCRGYQACGRPVYFVEDDWYERTYVPVYREKHGKKDHKHGKGHGKGHGKDHGKDKH